MKVFVQHKKTDWFLDGAGKWVADQTEAHDFRRAIAALEFCLRRKEETVWILLVFENEAFNVQLDPFKNSGGVHEPS